MQSILFVDASEEMRPARVDARRGRLRRVRTPRSTACLTHSQASAPAVIMFSLFGRPDTAIDPQPPALAADAARHRLDRR